MARLKSCSYCGKIHPVDFDCGKKPVYKKPEKKRSEEDRLRGLQVWKKKRKHINQRDNYMCQVCLRNLHNTQDIINTGTINVHHIVSMVEDIDMWLDDSNLICLCKYHHKMADDGLISKSELFDIVKEQERK